MGLLQDFFLVLEDYCRHSSLAGLKYIADPKRHFSERLFWICCFLSSVGASHFLITMYVSKFQAHPINIIVEPRSAHDVTQFPSVGVCEIYYSRETYPRLDKIIERLNLTGYNAGVEDFLIKLAFKNQLDADVITKQCNATTENKCPLDNYRELTDEVRANCTEIFASCEFNDKEFACCDFFKPLRTNVGTCFLLNSIQVSNKTTKEWIDLPVGLDTGPGNLTLTTFKPFWLYVLNEEDIPNDLIKKNHFIASPSGYMGEVSLSRQRIINDESVRHIHPLQRKCYFPDEQFATQYRAYSYSVCITECLKQAQLKRCNCTYHYMIFDDNDKFPACGFAGLHCLEQNTLLRPLSEMMQPWNDNGLQCLCYPSCNEHEIKIVGFSDDKVKRRKRKQTRSISVVLQQIPNQRYRRQTVREQLDVIVSVGGILGLFLGASLLSLLELLHFFTVRVLVTYWQRRRHSVPASHEE